MEIRRVPGALISAVVAGALAYRVTRLYLVMQTLNELFDVLPELRGIQGELILGEFARFLVIQSAKSKYSVLDEQELEKAVELHQRISTRDSAEWWMQILPDLLGCNSASEQIDVFNRWSLTTLHRDLANSWAAKKVAQVASVN